MEHVKRKSWKEFRESGLLWWMNHILHTFGWAIVYDNLDENGEPVTVYPARVRYRGFYEKVNTNGFIKVSKYLKENAEELLKEAEE